MKNSTKCKLLVLFFTLSLGLFLAGCSGSEGPQGDSVTVTVTAEAVGVNCLNGGSKVDFTDSEGSVLSSIYICNGENGDSPVVTAEDPGTNCELGGVKVDYLGATSYVCNGETGTNGAAGANGANGQSVTVTVESAGANCANGGLQIVSVSGTNYVCNGVNGTNGTNGQSVAVTVEAAGPNCANGGLRLVSASGTNYVCNGAPGTNGTNGVSVVVTVISAGGVCGTATGINVRLNNGVDPGSNICNGVNGTNGINVIVTPIAAGGVCGPQTGVNVNDDDGVADGVNICAGMGVIVTPIAAGGACGDLAGVNVNDDDGVADGVDICEGADGLNCWDLDEDGVKDLPAEDLNGDGEVDVWDCTGVPAIRGSVEGYVLYGPGWPAEGAEVYITSQGRYTLTDRFGYYRLDNLEVGSHHILLVEMGSYYNEVIEDIHVIADDIYPVHDIYLHYKYPAPEGIRVLSGANATFPGKAAGDQSGYSVSGAGDVNGDGLGDVLIGAYYAAVGGNAGAGETYLYYGDLFREGAYDLSLPDAVFQGKAAGDYSGSSISGAGDVNGDGFDDILIGAYYADPNGSNSGETYLIYGSAMLAGTIGLASADATFTGKAANDNSGNSVSGAGDVNGDGYDDILIGAYGADPNGSSSGETYLIYGSATLSGTIGLASADATFTGKAADDQSGYSVSGAGDVNGNGYDDILVGAWGADPSGNSAAGESYLIYGSATLSGTKNLASANAIFTGQAASNYCGVSVSGAGDVNGDGYDDILIGANAANDNAGRTYLIHGSASLPNKWPMSITNPNVTFQGKVKNDNSGYSVSGAGDVNGDGYDDILIGAYGADSGGNTEAGDTYLIYGGTTLPDKWPLAITNPNVTFQGKVKNDDSGWSVSGAGDVNGDGFNDILIGAYNANPGGSNNAGETYLIYGGIEPQRNIAAREISGTHSLGQADAFFMGKAASNRSGNSVSDAGDVNGDGFGDILIGAYYAAVGGNANAGETYLYYGDPFREGAYDPSLPDAVFQGKAAGDESGYSVSGAGDVNGDGYDDILIGAEYADPNGSSSGETYLIYGSTTLSGTIGLANADVLFQGKAMDDFSGYSVSGAGDVNGDGYDDILIGAYGVNSLAGETYLIYGAASLPSKWPLATTSPNATFTGRAADDQSGYSVSGAGDVNGDGYDDILIGAFARSTFAGESYLIFGSATLSGTIGLAGANAAFTGKAASDWSGYSVSGAGDVNGDGFDDVLIGAQGANSWAGETYLIFGRATLSGTIGLASADATFTSKAAGDESGWSVSGAGDVNGDDYDDILIAAPYADPNGNSSGETYLIYGNATLSGAISLSTANATFTGKASSDYSGYSVSGAGDVNGDGFSDILIGAYVANPLSRTDAGETYLIYGSGIRPLD